MEEKGKKREKEEEGGGKGVSFFQDRALNWVLTTEK